MLPSSDIILVGAGRSPKTKWLRRQAGPVRRTFYIGPLQVKSGLRAPVDIDFVKKHYDQIRTRVEEGTLLVEYKFDKFVDVDELRTLAYGSDAEKEAYEKEVEAQRESKAVEQRMAADELREQQAEAARLSALGPQVKEEGWTAEDEEVIDEGTDKPATTVDNATRLAPAEIPGGAVDSPKEPGDNLAGSHEETITSPRELADLRAAEYHAQHEEPEFKPTANPTPERTADPEYKPLPDGWETSKKAELLAYCEERGIDVSDMPSNKELRRRLDAYVAGT